MSGSLETILPDAGVFCGKISLEKKQVPFSWGFDRHAVTVDDMQCLFINRYNQCKKGV